MSNLETFITNPFSISATSFYPRNYSPNFIFVKEGMKNNPCLLEYIAGEVTGGSTPPAHLFCKSNAGVPFIKTSAVSRHFINTNDLHSINNNFHSKNLKRSITRPYDIIYTMTGKFMGKAAMCPSIISEMNMSQNSVVLHTKSPEESAFLTIFLNSEINRIQVKGTYSITKQKFMNQSKIASLKVMEYDMKYESLMKKYLSAFNSYYESIDEIQNIVELFNEKYKLSYDDVPQYGFSVKTSIIRKCMLTPNHYRNDVLSTINSVKKSGSVYKFDKDRIRKGDEVGSAFYKEEGIPFIKTSDIMNYDIDHEPDCYCSESFISQLAQDIKIGDVIFAKDGKPGEVAIIKEDNQAVLSSGIVKYRPQNDIEGYWIFLLLSSQYGAAYFKKWFVIASTMLHLRADFLNDFEIPVITDDIYEEFIKPLARAFELKAESYLKIKKIKEIVEASYTNNNVSFNI